MWQTTTRWLESLNTPTLPAERICALLELCGDPGQGQWFEPRMMIELFESEEQAAQALDKYLADWARRKLAQERQQPLQG